MTLNARSKEIRRNAIKLSINNGGYHYGSSFSCTEILINLYDHILKKDDIFILSKGHGCWCFYALLIEKNYNPKLEGHPNFDPKNGVYCTSGSLGHGFPLGVGLALAKRLKKESGNIYVLIGDGESQEGTTWESILIASKLKLNNLTVIVDNNKLQGSGPIDDILPVINILISAAKAASWSVHSINGHSSEIITITKSSTKNPRLIIADTIKGKGVSFMEGSTEWHAQGLTEKFKEKALKELI
jgi:transketolase